MTSSEGASISTQLFKLARKMLKAETLCVFEWGLSCLIRLVKLYPELYYPEVALSQATRMVSSRPELAEAEKRSYICSLYMQFVESSTFELFQRGCNRAIVESIVLPGLKNTESARVAFLLLTKIV